MQSCDLFFGGVVLAKASSGVTGCFGKANCIFGWAGAFGGVFGAGLGLGAGGAGARPDTLGGGGGGGGSGPPTSCQWLL